MRPPSFTSGGLFAIGIQVPESLLQQQKKKREIREIRAKNIRNKAAKAPTSPPTVGPGFGKYKLKGHE